jgi:hypothetical protein
VINVVKQLNFNSVNVSAEDVSIEMKGLTNKI